MALLNISALLNCTTKIFRLRKMTFSIQTKYISNGCTVSWIKMQLLVKMWESHDNRGHHEFVKKYFVYYFSGTQQTCWTLTMIRCKQCFPWLMSGQILVKAHTQTHTDACTLQDEGQSLFQWTFLLSECLVCISHRLQWNSWIHSVCVHMRLSTYVHIYTHIQTHNRIIREKIESNTYGVKPRNPSLKVVERSHEIFMLSLWKNVIWD